MANEASRDAAQAPTQSVNFGLSDPFRELSVVLSITSIGFPLRTACDVSSWIILLFWSKQLSGGLEKREDHVSTDDSVDIFLGI